MGPPFLMYNDFIPPNGYAFWLQNLEVGQIVARTIDGRQRRPLWIQKIEAGVVTVSDGSDTYTFRQETGGEISDELGWDGKIVAGAFLVPLGDRHG